MRPALSIVFFTTLSGAGYGLLAWLGVSLLGGLEAPGAWWASLGALALISAGLASSLAHLGQPQRAWRALSQWRTSWLSREGVMALLTYVPALALTLGLAPGVAVRDGVALRLAGVASAVLALATIVCTAMIYASLKPIPAWRDRLVVPGYLLLALLSGGALYAVLIPSAASGRVLMGLCAASAVAKLVYWHRIDRLKSVDRAGALGVATRKAHVFEAPHTEANYITRELVFRIARKHARALRLTAAVLLAALPVLLLARSLPWREAGVLPNALVAASILAGVFVERWLFFAEARHVVSVYYQERP